jgi:hypothetical protein
MQGGVCVCCVQQLVGKQQVPCLLWLSQRRQHLHHGELDCVGLLCGEPQHALNKQQNSSSLRV